MSDSTRDPSTLHGEQGVTPEDRAYSGSTYSEVRDAVLANPYQKVWGAPGEPPFPHYQSTLKHVYFGGLKAAAARTVDSQTDLRWGKEGTGYRRIVHPNGIVLFGTWEIDHDNPYSGYFRNGSRGLVVSRLSPNGSAVARGQTRSIGLTAKIYPTTDEGHGDLLIPANIYTQQDLGGAKTDHLDEAELRNAPDTHAFQGVARLLALGALGLIFGKTDEVADVRQVHEVAELGKPDGEPTRAPKYLKLTVAPGHKRIDGAGLDFRDEVYGLIYDKGDPTPKRTLSFDVAVSDDGRPKGPPIVRTVVIENWKTIGRITYTSCCASFNGDHVIHFHHPNWRLDRNDPDTAVRKNGERVR